MVAKQPQLPTTRRDQRAARLAHVVGQLFALSFWSGLTTRTSCKQRKKSTICTAQLEKMK